jgi:hypothetical protein
MRKHASLFGAILAGLSIVAFAAPAHAQATRTWVSGVGDDVNPCSRTAPCKTFAGAISKTAAGGEINCLDSAGFGGVTITKAMSIICTGVEGGVLVSGGPGITVNAGANDRVLLEGLDIIGINQTATPGTIGVRVLSAGRTTISKCKISNFSQFGVSVAAPVSARVFITDSLVTGNTLGGMQVQGTGGVVNNAIVDRTTFDNNGAAAIKLGPAAVLVVSGSVLTGSTASIDATAGGTVSSYGNSVIRPVATINTPLTLQ